MTALGAVNPLHNAQPFSGQGASLYVTSGSEVQYRRMVMQPRRRVLRQGWSGRNAKTLRVDSDTGVSDDQIDFAYDISGLAAGSYVADVRHYKNHWENLATNDLTQPFTIDGSAAEVAAIRGTVTWHAPEIRSGGIVRFRWAWHAADVGTQPTLFRVDFTAGPTSPADLTINLETGRIEYVLDSAALSDASAYTVVLKGENGATTATLATDSVTADATGPAAPTLVSISAR